MKTNKVCNIKKEHLIFLDDLRLTGVTNMFGAVQYLIDEFPGMTKMQANRVLRVWMKTFTSRHQGE